MERQLPLAPPPLTELSTTAYLPPNLKGGLTAAQAAILDELNKNYTKKVDEVKATPPSRPWPGQLQQQREMDGKSLLSLKLAEFDAGLKLAQETCRALRTQWNIGALTVTQNEFDKILRQNEHKVNHFLSRVCTLQNHREEILGRIKDDSHLLRVEPQDDWAYIDGLLREFLNPRNATKTTKTIKTTKPNNIQARFRDSLIKSYDAEEAPNKAKSPLWCPISAAFHEPNLLRAAHIVKKNVGENAAAALFGETTDTRGLIWQPANGLLLHQRYETWWSSGIIAIVPSSHSEDEFQVVVLDHAAFAKEAIPSTIPSGSALDGKRLQFRGEFRPDKRFLYFKFAVTLLRRQQIQVPGSVFGHWKLPTQAKELWLTPGSHLTGSVLFKLARQLGFLTPSQAMEFWGIPPGANFEEDYGVSSILAMDLQRALYSDDKGDVEMYLRKMGKKPENIFSELSDEEEKNSRDDCEMEDEEHDDH